MRRPLIAILRGLRPAEAEATLAALVGAGISWIETPLNSPEPFESIARMAAAAPSDAAIGAGTVLTPEDARRAAEAGATFLVSPNMDPAVIGETKRLGLLSIPGVYTAREALAAIDAGADALKLFPASALGPGGLRALKAVLPPTTPVYAVGGADPAAFPAWIAAGADGFGIGSALYAPGWPPSAVGARAAAAVRAYDAAAQGEQVGPAAARR